MHTIAIIPARGGSKAIPRKNVIEFCGFPLLSWTIAAARRCRGIARVYVSTDDREIADVANAFGAEVIDRPAELSTDRCSSESAVLHACREAELREGRTIDRVVMLQVTSPLREAAELDGALRHFDEAGIDSLFSAASPEDFLIWRGQGPTLESVNYDWRSRKRRQDADEAGKLWIETGSFYVTRRALLVDTGNRLGGAIGTWEVPLWKSFEIDSPAGLEWCRVLMNHYGLAAVTPAEFRRSAAQS